MSCMLSRLAGLKRSMPRSRSISSGLGEGGAAVDPLAFGPARMEEGSSSSGGGRERAGREGVSIGCSMLGAVGQDGSGGAGLRTEATLALRRTLAHSLATCEQANLPYDRRASSTPCPEVLFMK